MTDILAAIDGALDASAHASAEVTGNPWPGRVPSLDEMLEAVFGPEDGADLPDYLAPDVLVPAFARGYLNQLFTSNRFGRDLAVERAQGVSPVSHLLDTWQSLVDAGAVRHREPREQATLDAMRRGLSLDYVIEDEVLRFGTDRPYLNATTDQELRREALIEEYRRALRLAPPSLTAFRMIGGTGA